MNLIKNCTLFSQNWFDDLLKDSLSVFNQDLNNVSNVSSDFNSLLKESFVKNKEGYILKLNMPGYDLKDIKVEVLNNSLIVTAFNNSVKTQDYWKSNKSFKYSCTLPKFSDTDSIQAEYKSGVLVLTMKEIEFNSESKQITVK